MANSLLFTVLVDQHWFGLVLVGSQVALVCSAVSYTHLTLPTKLTV